MSWGEAIFNDPLGHIFLALAFGILWFFLPPHADKAALIVTLLLSYKVWTAFKANRESWTNWHERLIENYLPFTVLVFVAVAIGGAVQIVPTLIVNREKNIEGRLQELYTPLELAGRDIYVSEGCYNCHSQMIRTLVHEVMRYGRPGVVDDYSHLGESLFDHPYQWGSKRTGPDLAREGGPIAAGAKYMRLGKRGNDWHFNHFLNPRQTSPGSNMPAYPWLFEKETDLKSLPAKIATQRKIGVPWPALNQHEIRDMAESQAQEIAANLVEAKVYLPAKPDLQGEALRNHLAKTRVVALIAYMQKLGAYREIKGKGGPRPLDPDSQRPAAVIQPPDTTQR
jgi:cytochrome c oxidase cbb3-type subunit I/II